MSLINDMLRNLDARGAGARPATVLEPALAEPRRERPGRGRAVLVVAALAGGTLAAVWLAPRELPLPPAAPAAADEPAAAPPAQLPEVSRAPAVETSAPEAPAPALVRGVELAQTTHGTRLSLELSAPTAHRVERGEGGRKLEVVLAGARLGAEIPPLDLAHSPIESFDVEQRESDLHLLLALAEPVRVQSGMHGPSDAPRFSLDFIAAPAAPPAAPAAKPEPTGETDLPPAALAKEQDEPARVRTPRLPTPAEQAALQHRRALDLVAAGDSAGAEAALLEVLALDPTLHAARGALARLLLARADLPAALAVLELSAPPLAQDPDYHALHAALLSRAGEHARAADLYARLVAHDARRAPWWLGLGISLEAQARGADALAAYREASRRAGLDAEAQGWVEGRIAALASGG